MKIIGLFTVAVFTIAWAGALIAWFYTVYHAALFVICWWRDTPTDQGLVAKFLLSGKIWFRSDITEMARMHRRKALIGVAAFLVCWAVGIFDGLIGVWLGGWQTDGY